ncbi:MAG TPA: zf-HC2 domain-containing protein [Steroidobacteraceae bacterium]|nr:zf-HC2 domain-containing protein [Steroidobacteraceae bacterium]
MSARIPDTHAEAWALLPWLANGRLAAEDREWVEAHLQACAECRAELDAQRRVAGQMNGGNADFPQPVASDEQRSFNKLWARIEAAEAASPAATGTAAAAVPVTRSSRTVRWLAAAVVVQALGLGVLGMALNGSTRGAGEIRTVTSPERRPHAPTVTLVFAPQASMSTVNTMLAHQGLSIVSGPGLSGNYRAELSPDAVASGATAESVAAVISKDPNVVLAQPIAR